jgi:hypothetical protein
MATRRPIVMASGKRKQLPPGDVLPKAAIPIGGRVYIGDLPPDGAVPNDGWLSSVDGALAVLYDDGTSTQWVVSSGPAGPKGDPGIQGAPGIQGPQPPLASATPAALGTAAAGSAATASRADHVHSSVITSLKEVRGSMSASTMNLATGNVFAYAASANTAFAVSDTPPDGQVAAIILDLTVIGAPRLVSFWPGVKWSSGSAITSLPAGRHYLGFMTSDGGVTWLGLLLAGSVA